MDLADAPGKSARNRTCCVRVGFMEQQTLRDLLTERGIRMDAAALMAGVSTSTISRICSGTEKARPETVVSLAKALHVSARRMQSLCDAASGTLAAEPCTFVSTDGRQCILHQSHKSPRKRKGHYVTYGEVGDGHLLAGGQACKWGDAKSEVTQ